MELTIDRDAYDDWQRLLVKTLAETIRDQLAALSLPVATKRDVTAMLTASIAGMLDGAIYDTPERFAELLVTFRPSASGPRLLGLDGSSWMHEYAQGAVDEMEDGEF